MVGDAGQQLAQVCFRVQAIELGRTDETVDRRSALAAGIGPCEQVILPPQSDRTQGTLGGIVVDLQATVVAGSPQLATVSNC